MRPTKHFEKGGERKGNGKIMERVYCMYGIITAKSPHIITAC
jgi:hypothetical protein